MCADEAGVAIVPREHAAAVLEAARRIDAGDTKRKRDIDSGAAVSDLMTKKYKQIARSAARRISGPLRPERSEGAE